MRKYVPGETGLQRNVHRLRSGVICRDKRKWEGEDEPIIIANLQNTEKKDPGMLSVLVQSCNLRTRRLRQEDHGFKATYTECI